MTRWMMGALALCAAPVWAGTAIDGIQFVDRNATGEIVLGGLRGTLAVLDYDDDGWPDLAIRHFTGSATRLFHNVPDPARPGYRTFVNVGAGSGLDDADGTSRGAFGVVAADIDNDGDTDLYMTGYHSNTTAGLLYRNDGGGHFANITVSAGLRTTGINTQSASFVDYDHDGYVDLMTFNSTPSPSAYNLYRNNHNNTFTDVTSILAPQAASGAIYAHLWMDYDGDGWEDAFILTRNGSATLLKNVDNGAGGRQLINVSAATGFVALGPAPMGIAAGDMDGDGDFDLSITDAVRGTYYRNNGTTLTQVTPFATFFGWGTTWLDVDNDGDLDNYQAGSFGTANVDHLTRNLGGGAAWDNISAALNTTALPSQHCVQVDFNNDGRQDIITINPGTPSISVYENISTTPGHWITLALTGNGVTTNRSAIGAVVRVTAGGVTQVRQLISGSSTSSTEDLRVHFGLGAATSVDSIQVLWPRQGTLASRTEVFTGPFAVDQILPIAESGPPMAVAWRSVRSHSGATLAIDLNPAASGNGTSGPTVESRIGGIREILIDLGESVTLVNAGAVSVTGRSTVGGVLQPIVDYSMLASVSSLNADTLRIAFAAGALPDETCYRVSIAGALQTTAGAPIVGDTDCSIRSMAGDVTGDGAVLLGDALAAKSQVGAPASSAARFDINLSGGTISLGDALAARARVTSPAHAALCP